MSKARTKEESVEMFLEQIYQTKEFWEKESRCQTLKGKMEGLVFSILAMFDGSNAGFPALDISLQPHPDDKQYHQDNDEDWFEPGMVINDEVELHGMWQSLRAEKDKKITTEEMQKRSDKKHRKKIRPEALEKSISDIKEKLLFRLNEEKGWGTWTSRHEILGFLTEEYYEVIKEVHSGNEENLRKELIDVAVGCIFAVACIDEKGLDW